MITLNARSERNLNGVHPDLVRVVRKAAEISQLDFIVTEGLRTVERQKQLIAAGASKTMRSRHIRAMSKFNKYGHAVDVAVKVNGKVRWDWPLYHAVADTMKRAAAECHVPIEWGGDWKSFKDGPHFQLPWSKYP